MIMNKLHIHELKSTPNIKGLENPGENPHSNSNSEVNSTANMTYSEN